MGSFQDLIELSNIDPVREIYNTHYEIATENNLQLSSDFLLNYYKNFNPRPGYYTYENNSSFKLWIAIACLKGYETITEFPQLTNSDYNIFLIFACKGGSVNLVEYILDKCQYNPFTHNYGAIRASVNHIDVMKRMFRYTESMSDADYRDLVADASYDGTKSVVKFLLEKRDIVPFIDLPFPEDIFKYLLKNPKVDAPAYLEDHLNDPFIDHESPNYLYLETFSRKYPNLKTKTQKLKLDRDIKKIIREYNSMNGVLAVKELGHIMNGLYLNDLKKLRKQKEELGE